MEVLIGAVVVVAVVAVWDLRRSHRLKKALADGSVQAGDTGASSAADGASRAAREQAKGVAFGNNVNDGGYHGSNQTPHGR